MSKISSGTSTPSSSHPPSQTTTSYLSYPVTHIASSLYRRLTDPSPNRSSPFSPKHDLTAQASQQEIRSDTTNGVYTPPHRTASPFQPPPLTPLTLSGATETTILSKAVAEEIRLLVPPRLQLAEKWSLSYSLSTHGVSLATLYKNCSSPKIPRGSSFVLVVQDAAGGIFGAYLTDAPKPSPSFYGTGECFLWRASILPSSSSTMLANLPPPPSADTEGMGRSTTIHSPSSPSKNFLSSNSITTSANNSNDNNTKIPHRHSLAPSPPFTPAAQPSANGQHQDAVTTSTPQSTESIRFKAFPYSGINDYLIFCQQDYLSVGGGDGRYGLWLDEVLERGVSGGCMTFGNEGLSEEGEKFEVVGVEVWCLGG